MWLLIQQTGFILASNVIRFRRKPIRELAGRRLANGLLRLGPLYVKLGQIISCRKNLLGEEWITAMAILQDQIPAREGEDPNCQGQGRQTQCWETISGQGPTWTSSNTTRSSCEFCEPHIAKKR